MVQILRHLFPVRLIEQFMPVPGIQPQCHVPYPGSLVFLINLPHALPNIW